MDSILTRMRRFNRAKWFGAYGQGFTLLEVLVALVIIFIAMTSVYRLQGDTVRMSGDKRFYSLAPKLAKGKLAEIETQGLKNASDGSGDFGQEFPGYTWNVRMEDVQSNLIADLAKKSQQRYHLTRIDITVTQDEKVKYELRTYRFYAE